ncbi:hypothetical protein MPH_08361 [Macrophomina phaseolina MS6]|uniref:tyrosine--tRNA ligase n=2 Tax=Macrophomina phaseolina TaxID=35725 RepID=K2RP30_MACPH|nr:hypothetical protein MPH_08361 [Macrophomina phaseolina MS6]KAH7062628.1 hypothetical protein B0J12DRAFT_764001 [Macrophomina phaseolina]
MATVQQRAELVTRCLEHLHASGEEAVVSLLSEKQKPRVAWDTAPTGKPHVGYFVPLTKLIDFLRAGLEVVVYYGDVYAFLVNYVHPMEQVAHRTAYYKFLVSAILDALGVPSSAVRHVQESSLANTKDWFIDLQKMSAAMTQQDARDTMEEVARTDRLSPMLCAIQQTLSEPYLDLDIQFGGVDQRYLFLHAEKFLPVIGYRKRLHLMSPLIDGLDGQKMSSSKPADTKIEFLDDAETVERKISGAACPDRDLAGNGILCLLRHVLLPVSRLWLERTQGKAYLNEGEGEGVSPGDRRPFVSEDAPGDAIFSVPAADGSGQRHFSSYEHLEESFLEQKISPAGLKAATAAALNRLLEPIRRNYQANEEWQRIEKLAYP